jgi:hypothetical protein
MPDDMRIPTRSDSQISQDATRTFAQVHALGQSNPSMLQVLKQRHAAASGALKFETVGRANGGDALVVSRQVVVPASAGRDQAHIELTSNHGFVMRRLSEDDPHSAALHDSVWVYSYEVATADEAAAHAVVDAAQAALAGAGVAAPRTMVTALHMVIKAEGGPAPTSVTVESFPLHGAPTEDEIVVAVIDTGIDGDFRADGWLNEVVRGGNVDALDALPDNGLLDFGAGHGTFVAGVIRQVDPKAKVVVYRGLDSDGLASEEAVAAAIVRAAGDGAHVINLSLGMQAVDDARACPALRAAVAQVQAGPHGPAIVASAGNYGNEERVYPAALHGVVAVAALKGVGAPGHPAPGDPLPAGAEWSSRGSWVTCSAVGEGIVSTFVDGTEDPEYGGNDTFPQGGQGDSWAVWSGTSFAAPQISALIAKTCREDNLTPEQAVDALFPSHGAPTDGYGKRVVLLPGTRATP